MNKLLIAIVIVIVFFISGGLLFFNQSKSQIIPSPQPKQTISSEPSINPADEQVDYQASFAIFTNGTFRIFTAAMYHNLSEDVFIRAENPNIIQVKKEGVTWDDFFKTLPFKLAKDCLTTGTGQTFCSNGSGELKFFRNGIPDPGALDRIIAAGDQLLVSYGKENNAQIQKQIQQIPIIKID